MNVQSSEGLSDRYLHLNNCARQRPCDTDYHTIRPRGRVDCHMLILLSGYCRAVVCGEEIEARRGSVVFFRPNERQEYHFYQAIPSEDIFIHFTGVGCQEYLMRLGIWEKHHFQVELSSRLMDILNWMIIANETKELQGELADAYLGLALTLLAEGMHKKGDDSRIREDLTGLLQRIHEKPSLNLSVPQCADFCHLSVSRFQHVFKEIVGMSYKSYLLHYRIEYARSLLENTQLPCKEIAVHVGITDSNYFQRLFRQQTGVSPGRYRKMLQP